MNEHIRKKINLARKLIQEDLSNNFSVNDLAAECELEVVFFIECFTQLYGTTPKQYICDLRLERLSKYIMECGTSVSKSTGTIARNLGYSRRTSLYTFVRRRTGLSWDEYARKVLRKDRL